MVILSEELARRGITVYKLLKTMGKSMGRHYHYSQKINGDILMRKEELEMICKAASSISNEPLKPEDLASEVVAVKMVNK